jgi:hypothetical protein
LNGGRFQWAAGGSDLEGLRAFDTNGNGSLDGGTRMKPHEKFIYATTNAILGDRVIDVADVFLAFDERPDIAGGGHHGTLHSLPELLAVGIALA